MKNRPGRRRRRWPWIVLATLVVLAAVGGMSLGFFLRMGLPDVRRLEDLTPPVMSTVLSSDGTVLETFAEQRRILIDYRSIPEVFLHALLATEDRNFLRHVGIDAHGVARAAWTDARDLQLTEGASTLTMQLARMLFLHRKKTVGRKLREALLALEIERSYTKEEILRLYCNHVYIGHGRYGIEAGARFYLGKSVRSLNLPEAALLAGILQRPESLSPYRNPERARARRAHVLSRMVAAGYLTEEERERADRSDLALREETPRVAAPHFVEEVRRRLKTQYGDSAVYREGLVVRTTLDPRMQQLANEAVDFGLRQLDKRQGWRGVERRVPPGEDPASWESPSWKGDFAEGAIAEAVVVAVDRKGAHVRVGRHAGVLGTRAIAWTGSASPSSLLQRGDVVEVRLLGFTDTGEAELSLEQDPRAEAALVAIDPGSGAVRALVGGFDFRRSEWNHATQAKRQTGSAFKPFVYAAALAGGWTLADRILDEPTVFIDPWSGDPYQPENYSRTYHGNITLRSALEKSANIATVKLLLDVGYDAVIELARDLGIRSRLHPYPSLGLGAFEVSLMELTGAYATFANRGIWLEPHLVVEVRDRQEAILATTRPEVREALSPRVAHLVNSSLEGVVTDGTGRAAASLGIPVAGKTGTTDNNTDAWFVGYSPELAVGVWVGFDDNRSLGSTETGAHAALPIWMRFMETAHAGEVVDGFRAPAGMTFATIDRETGLRADPERCTATFREVFISDTEPTRRCRDVDHDLLEMPYPLHRFAPGVDGRLEIPAQVLDELLSVDPSLRVDPGGDRIVSVGPEREVSLPLAVVPGGEPPVLPDRMQRPGRPTRWAGTDGHRARIVLLDRE